MNQLAQHKRYFIEKVDGKEAYYCERNDNGASIRADIEGREAYFEYEGDVADYAERFFLDWLHSNVLNQN